MEDRRRYPRVDTSGTVRLSWWAPLATRLEGELKDLSDGGFRAAHGSSKLEAGQEVWFEHEYGEGRARVIWTRVSPGSVESGFMYLPDGN